MHRQCPSKKSSSKPPRPRSTQAMQFIAHFNYSNDPSFSCVSYLPLKATLKTPGSRPPSPPGNRSLCSTRSSSSSAKAIKRTGSVHQGKHQISLEVGRLEAPCTAKSWAITNVRTSRMCFGKGEDEMREIASLTKIMTCYLSLLLIKDFRIDLKTETVVSAKAAEMVGTSAGLRTGDRIQLLDLIHGLMLPSGNDAAQCISEFLGRHIAERRGYITMTKKFDKLFIREMNVLANALCLRRTYYQNPHGMSIKKNHSTARDVSALAVVALRNSLFRDIVSTRNYTCAVVNCKGVSRTVVWENTNKLLEQGCEGVKTGVTDAAGPCLCASMRQGENRIVVTVLGARSMEERWVEVPKLATWAFDHIAKT